MKANLMNHGSVLLLCPLDAEARAWLAENIDPDAQYFGRGLVVTPRYVEGIVNGFVEDGGSIMNEN